jgi:hypothetical protein
MWLASTSMKHDNCLAVGVSAIIPKWVPQPGDSKAGTRFDGLSRPPWVHHHTASRKPCKVSAQGHPKPASFRIRI